jgi:hypothetical protein
MNAKLVCRFVCVCVSNRRSVLIIAVFYLIFLLVEHPIMYRPILHPRCGILTVAVLEILFLCSVTQCILVSSHRILEV